MATAVIEKLADNNIGSEEKFNIDGLKYNPHVLSENDNGLVITNDAKEILSIYSLADMLMSKIYKLNYWETIESGDYYWYIDSSGYVKQTQYIMCSEDFFRIKIGNCFKTAKEAENCELKVVKKEDEDEI